MPNDFVKAGYNKAAKNYDSNRDQSENLSYLQKFSSLIVPNSFILDIGCGAGMPVDSFLINKGHRVIGIDISERMIELAKKNVPQGEFKVKDMSDLRMQEYKVDAIVSFYAIFHIPRESHLGVLEKMYSFLKPKGKILITMGANEWEGKEEDFHGAGMYWSHFGPEANRKMVTDSGFNVLLDEIDKHGRESHQIVIAEKD